MSRAPESDLLIRDRHRYRQLLRRDGEAAAELAERSRLALEARRERLPEISYPAQLPITEHVEEIQQLLRDHQVVVVAGETGSGKTTQLPKICLGAGFGVNGAIGHTQPRRIAARAVASRIAEELQVELGGVVGYSVRFSDVSGDDTLVRLMTDGLLLTELRSDRFLNRYELLIVDEAHERSLNIDFLLGVLKDLLPRRSDLKLVITSATIDESAFASHFGDAPIVRVSGRSFPVDIRYVAEPETLEERLAACFADIRSRPISGARDVLMFCTGEREIMECARLLRDLLGDRWEILPLYARLSAKEQARVFQPGRKPRVVLATNVAETSLTVPNIGYVIDPGEARLSRYSYRSKLQRLPVEPISQASATQRAGRCGRIAPGVCYRLFEASDFEGRPAFTEPEIRRSNLAAVVLTMRAFALGDVRRFPFIDPPAPKAITDAERLLEELGALAGERLSAIGKTMARLPIDPRLARMLIAADKLGSLRELLIITSALATQDPRERPLAKRAQADAAHERFVDERSDFLSFLKIWEWAEEERQARSNNQYRKTLQRQYLSPVRMREWRSLYTQLRGDARRAGLSESSNLAGYGAIHEALIAGSLSLLGQHDERGLYRGARNATFRIFPGSALAARGPKWLIAAEITETSRFYARCVGGVSPQWLERAGSHLLRRSHSEPHWDAKRGEAMIFERTVLYGLTLAERRAVRLASVDAALARDRFLREGLLQGALDKPPDFVRHNLEQIRSVLALEARGRQRDLLADEDTLVAFYDERLPQAIAGTKALQRWLRRAGETELQALLMTPADVRRADALAPELADYPGELAFDDLRLRLKYRFAPGEEDDGLNVQVPLGVLAALSPEPFAWLVPGMLDTLLEALLRTLPKRIRRKLAPVPDRVRELLPVLTSATIYRQGSLLERLADALDEQFGVTVTPADWRAADIDGHLRPNFRVLGKRGRLLAQGRDLGELQERLLQTEASNDGRARAARFEQQGVTSFPDQGLPAKRHLRGREEALVYPALVDVGEAVDVVMCATPMEARDLNRQGYARLARLTDRQTARYVAKELKKNVELGLHYASLGSTGELIDRVLNQLYWHHYFEGEPLPSETEAFEARISDRRPSALEAFYRLEQTLCAALQRRFEIVRKLDELTSPAFRRAAADMGAQLTGLFGSAFPQGVDWPLFELTPDALAGMAYRLEHLQGRVRKDEQTMDRIDAAWARWRGLEDAAMARPESGAAQEWCALRLAFEHWRLAEFAQPLGLHRGVSETKIGRRLDALATSLGVA
ncbi:MAG: ATP-dependent RNA helicase HrpA [Pseudomonadota bacterium]